MKKIRSEFLTESEANSAMEEIKPYCGNVKIINYGDYDPIYSDNGYGYAGYIPEGSFFGSIGFPEMGSFGLGGFGMISSWNFSPYSLTDRYKYQFPYSRSDYDMSMRTTLEADVADDNYEYIRDKLYSLGAMTVS